MASKEEVLIIIGDNTSEKKTQLLLFIRPGQSRGLLDKHCCHSLIHSSIHPFPPLVLRCRQAQTVGIGASSYKINYFAQAEDIVSLKGYTIHVISSKVTAIFMNWLILPIG